MWWNSFWMPVSLTELLNDRAANMYSMGLTVLLMKTKAPAMKIMVSLALSRLLAALGWDSLMASSTSVRKLPT